MPYTGSTTSASQGLTIALNGFPSVASQCIGIASLVTPTAPFTTYYFRVSASGLVVSLIPGYMPFYPTMPITNGLTYGLTVDCAYIFDSGTSLPFGTTVYEKIETTNGTTPVNVPIISFAQSSIRWVESLGSNKTCRLYSELTVSDSNQTSPWNTIRLTFSPGWLFLNNITVPTNVTGKLLYCRTGQNPVMMGSYNEGVVNTASFRANSNFVASSVDAVLVSIIDFTFT